MSWKGGEVGFVGRAEETEDEEVAARAKLAECFGVALRSALRFVLAVVLRLPSVLLHSSIHPLSSPLSYSLNFSVLLPLALRIFLTLFSQFLLSKAALSE